MTTYYKVLRAVKPADLVKRPSFVGLLNIIPSDGYVTRDHFRDIEEYRITNGLGYACSIGILKMVSPFETIADMESVKFWCTQLNDSGLKNTVPKTDTRRLYMRTLSRLNEWLPGRCFPSHKTVMSDGQIERQPINKSFANVEEMMHYCIESDHGTKTAQRVIREYMTNVQMTQLSDSTRANARAAIKSYFSEHDIVLNLPKIKKKQADNTVKDDPMTLEDFYKMLQKGNPGIVMRTIMLIKLHSGMDSSTFTDRFNYNGYSQIVKYFGTENHSMWNPDLCPVPITLVRVKTGVRYTTFIERDAITQLQEYLTWKEVKYGKQDISKPLFMTTKNMPVSSIWLSRCFSQVAVRAGIQKKVSPMLYKIRAHEVRDILKSTLMTSGCVQYAADHVLGHAPRDSYEKQSTLYPAELRAEYTKASSRINIFSKVEYSEYGQRS